MVVVVVVEDPSTAPGFSKNLRFGVVEQLVDVLLSVLLMKSSSDATIICPPIF